MINTLYLDTFHPVAGYLPKVSIERRDRISNSYHTFSTGRMYTLYLGTFDPVFVDLTPCIWVLFTLYL
jgi:hypothetical protein